ncbi:chromosome segregation protein SMC [Methylorubrum populi]|uniref:AAA family ATPase n=1 Tax=Methylorubrum populi TaxID=223967 RepID=UPI002F320A80
MRILAIRGENLASLAAPFAVDLAAEPLGATGLFAITGETGAGKSTILDALCLALYGRYPRVAVSRREDVPDPGGEALSASDGRAILRRGAGAGFAEVDFVGRDGVAYRVGWEAYRARNRATGKLQAERRRLHRLDDGSAVAAGKTAVLEKVVELTDLNFDQFRRTVLLAQGEFDAFLLAAEGERAELLEKITGTAIYSEISKRVHLGYEEHRRAVEALEMRRQEIGLLNEDGVKARDTERAERLAQVAAWDAEQEAVGRILETARRIETARTALAQAEQRAAATREVSAAAASDRTHLADLDAVEPLRGRVEALNEVGRERQAARAAVEAVRVRVTAAQGRADACEATRAEASAADEAAETVFKSFGPVWDRAAALDAAVTHAEQEAAGAGQAASRAAEAEETARIALAALDLRLGEAREAGAAAARRLDADRAHAPLAERGDEFARRIRERARLRGQAEAAAAEGAARRCEITACDGDAQAGTVRLAELRARREALAAARAEREAALEALAEPAAQVRAGALEGLLDLLREAYALAGRHATALADRAAAAEAETEAAAAFAEAAARYAAEDAALQEAGIRRSEIAPLAELAEESVSREAARLRSLLVSGGPCPVCGSADHPHAHESEGALGRLAGEMRARRAELDERIGRHQAARDRARGDAAAAEGRLEDAQERAAAAAEAAAAAGTRYRAALPTLATALEVAGLACVLPQEPDAPVLAATGAMARAERDAVLRSLTAARTLRGEIDGLIRDRDAAEARAEAETRALDALTRRRTEAGLAAERAESTRAALLQRVADLSDEIGPALSAADLSLPDLDHAPEEAADRIAALGQSYAGLRAQHAELEAQIAALAPERAAAASLSETEARAAAKARTEAAERQARLAQSRQERAGLLGGEATGAHRTRLNNERHAARDALKEAQAACAEAARALTGAIAEAAGAAAAAERADARYAATDAAFTQACGARGREAVSALLALPPEARTALRARLDRLSREESEAATALATRRADLDALRSEVEIDVAAARAESARLSEAIAEAQQRLGALDAELRRDEAARAKAADLAGQIETARAELSTWHRVEEAIGSAGGDRFRRFAQGVTLDHLVHLANEQLRALSPRYRLARSAGADLALHVVDRDMGDERRATRSLSGGERFLVSLALALALSGLEGRQSFVDTLFIDEGFGSLDAETLDLAVDALETLQGRGRKVGVITHVAGMMERIAVQIRVEKRGSGRSVVRVVDRGTALA